MNLEDVTTDFREGYGEGLSAGVAMFRNVLTALETDDSETAAINASILRPMVKAGEQAVAKYRARLMNL